LRYLGGRALEYLPPLLLLLALLGAWEAWVRVFDTKPYVLPAPSRVWDAFLEVRGTLPGHIRTTLTEALLGLFFACVIGVVLAAVIAVVPLVRRVLYPILVASQTIPMVVLAPLLIIWFGFGMTPKVVVVALYGFFPIVVATVDGLVSADREMVGLVRSMGAGRLAVLRYVLVPSALPGFFAGLKIAAAYAVLGAVIGEWVGASSGLGIFITRAQTSFRVDRVFVAVFVVALVSMALFAAVHIAARLATPWMYVQRSEDSK
jgi:ABC-type nitrate/sulfonate/bicarbonate transport system permease component